MTVRDPEKNFEELWRTFHERYPFFELRKVDWNKQYDIYRPKVTPDTSDEELFDLLCQMLEPLNDGHVELEAKVGGKKRSFTAEREPRFYQEFTDGQIKQLFKTTEKTLVANGFESPAETEAWMLHYGRSQEFGYMRILELEDVKKRKLAAALDKIARDFADLKGFIIDIRDCPGGDDSTAIAIIDRFCDSKRVAFHRRTKTGPGDDDFTSLKTWHLEPQGVVQFTGPIVLLTCDSVFSGGEVLCAGDARAASRHDNRRSYQRHILLHARQETAQRLGVLLVVPGVLFGRHGVLRGQRRAGRPRASQHEGRYRKRGRSFDYPRARSAEVQERDSGGCELVIALGCHLPSHQKLFHPLKIGIGVGEDDEPDFGLGVELHVG